MKSTQNKQLTPFFGLLRQQLWFASWCFVFSSNRRQRQLRSLQHRRWRAGLPPAALPWFCGGDEQRPVATSTLPQVASSFHMEKHTASSLEVWVSQISRTLHSSCRKFLTKYFNFHFKISAKELKTNIWFCKTVKLLIKKMGTHQSASTTKRMSLFQLLQY